MAMEKSASGMSNLEVMTENETRQMLSGKKQRKTSVG